MSEEKDYKRVYTGPDTNVQFLQDLFNKEKISSRVRNDFDSGLRAGFGGGLPGQVQLFVLNEDYPKAEKIAMDTFPEDYQNG